MTYYEALLFLHISAVAVWVGAAVLYDLLFFRARRAADPALAGRLSAHSEWLAKRLFIPMTLVVLVFGILLTIEGPWGFGDLWVVLGLVGWAITFAVGVGGIEPQAKRIHAAVERGGPDDPEVAWRGRRITALNYFDNVLLFIIIADMAIKPTGDDVGLLVVGAAIVLAGVGLVARVWRVPAPELPAAALQTPQA
jgi:uncharacterized membrane protein